MTLEVVAKFLKVKPQTIYTWAQTGKIPAAKLGKEWRFRKSVSNKNNAKGISMRMIYDTIKSFLI